MKTPLVVRMTAPVVATSLLLLAVGVGAAWYVQHWQRSVSREVRVNVSGVRAAEELEILVREIRTRLDHFLITGDPKYLRTVPPLRTETERWLEEAERWSLTPQEQALMARVRRGYEHFRGELGWMKAEGAVSELRRKVRSLIDDVLTREMLGPTHEFLDVNEDELEEAVTHSQAFADRLVYALLVLGVCGSGAGLLAGVGFARAFKRSLIQLSVPVRAAAGHLDEVVGPITFSAGGDLKELEDALRRIADRIGETIARLRQSEREALRAEQLAALGQMAAGMAHELRNPLTSMKILVQGAMADPYRGGGPGLNGRDLLVLEEEIGRLERLTRSFLDFARPPQPVKQTVDVRPLVEQTLRLVAARAARDETRLDFRAAPGPVRAVVDPGQFRQVLLNLLLNALDAVGSGGTVTVELEGEPSGGLTLRVTDTGCGLPPALGSRIFSPFTTTKEAGLGLGLSICKRIAEAHGGEITGADRPERGAVFTLRLPPAPSEQEAVGTKQ